ncbi:hypothetical protein JOC94_001387 [Bacillus thermophilus]|uniref:Uncharacterized protein n=1 Tax=Siminovitchia thermophila TaxID=1245522 RepID=A0ABS2R440_9BACI|nr:hypothetical protein [Siminovitchia thermophila]MBM7714415.1 hypothetical protein [Siminovitchia thermophila]
MLQEKNLLRFCGKVRDSSLQNKPVIVAGDTERRSGIVLVACSISKEV